MRFYIIITLFISVLLLYSETFSTTDSLAPEPDKNISEKQKSSSIIDSLSVSPEIAIIDSIKKDSIALDSIQKDQRRNSFLGTNRYYLELYQKHPQTLDSLYNPLVIYPFQIFQTDGMNFFDILHSHPAYISIPVTLASNLNRFLFYGLPSNHVAMHPNNSIFDFYIDPTAGHNLFSAAETKAIHFLTPGDIRFTLQPNTLTKPETSILWESGVFKENTLNIRFARPFTEQLRFGIFSNFQNFTRQNFSHGSGIYPFYRALYENIGLDSSYVSERGINPLTSEHVSSATLLWNTKSGAEARVSYKYADLHNDLSFEQVTIDTLTNVVKLSTLEWEERTQYSHCVNAQATSFPMGKKILLHAETMLQKHINRISPLSLKVPTRRGESFCAGGAINSCYSIGTDDTLSMAVSVSRDERIRHDNSKLVTHYTKPSINYIYTFKATQVNASAGGTFGYAFVKCNDRLEYIPTWKLFLSGTISNQNLRMYAQQDILPPTVPFDTAFFIIPGRLADRYQSVGAEGFFHYKKAGLVCGVCLTSGIDSGSLAKAWPNGVPPYQEPRWVFMVTPLFGKWYGLSLSSQWLLSDKKPYLKSKSTVAYHHNRPGRTQHLFIDLGFDYWSERDSLYYGGIDIWNRPIMDLHLKTTVQIKSFRLFYKIDNIFNSNFAYVPGYYMPGLVFRWGFNWLIQG